MSSDSTQFRTPSQLIEALLKDRGWSNRVLAVVLGDLDAAYTYELAPSGLSVQALRQRPRGLRAKGETRYRKYAEIDAATDRPRGFPTRMVK